MDMGWLSPLTEIAVSKVGAFLSVDLWISVKVPHTLDVHHNQLMTRTLKCEVAEGLCRGRKRRSCSRPDCGLGRCWPDAGREAVRLGSPW